MGYSIPIVVTGANGFVGRHVVRRLVQDGHQVSTITRSGVCDVEGVSNSIRGDLEADSPNPDWFRDKEILIHLAGKISGLPSDIPVEQSVNVRMARQLIAGINGAAIQKTIVLSSISASPDNIHDGGKNRYSREKAATDEVFLEQMLPNRNMLFLRPPAIYGPGMKGGIAPLFKMTAKGLPVPLGLAAVPRPYLSVRNLADLMSHIVVADDEAWEKCNRKFIEVHDGELVATNTLVRYIAAAQGKKARLLPIPAGVLRAVAKVLHKADMVSGALDPVVIEQSALLQDCFDWAPVEKMPDSLKFSSASVT